MRTKQGTLRGYDDDGFRRMRGCRGWTLGWFCDEILSPREAKLAVLELRGSACESLRPSRVPARFGSAWPPGEWPAWVWMLLPDGARGQLCVDCARRYREALRLRVEESLCQMEPC
jgi:hypothetical protein